MNFGRDRACAVPFIVFDIPKCREEILTGANLCCSMCLFLGLETHSFRVW